MYNNRTTEFPNYIKAKSPERLRLLMASLNFKNNEKYIFREIQYVKGWWYAWFDQSVSNEKLMREFDNDGK